MVSSPNYPKNQAQPKKTEPKPKKPASTLHDALASTAPAPKPSAQEAQDTQRAQEGLLALQEMATHSVELKNQLLYARAEIENMRKRHEKERTELQQYASTKVLRDLLDVADNMHRAFLSKEESANQDLKQLLAGLELTWKGFMEVLGKYGVKAMEAHGKLFDPNQHEAVLEQESTQYAPGTVMQVVQTGYFLADRLLRPARVIVAKAPAQTDENPSPQQKP